jgi:hypothetical protein
MFSPGLKTAFFIDLPNSLSEKWFQNFQAILISRLKAFLKLILDGLTSTMGRQRNGNRI